MACPSHGEASSVGIAAGAGDDEPRRSGGCLGALGVAAEPEQRLCRSRRQRIAEVDLREASAPGHRRPCSRALDGRVGEHPHVFAECVGGVDHQLTRSDMTAVPARQHDGLVADPNGLHTDARRAAAQLAVDGYGRAGELDLRLNHIPMWRSGNAFQPVGHVGVDETVAEH